MIKNILFTVLVILSTLMASQPIMTVLEEVIVPDGYQLIAASPVELRSEVIGFSLAIGACLSLVVGVAGYIHSYSLPIRLMFVLSPDPVRIDSEWVLPGRTGHAGDVAFKGRQLGSGHCA